MPSKIDGVLEAAGAFGTYQWRQITLAATGCFCASFHFLSIVFHSITPSYRCILPHWSENDTYSPVNFHHNQTIYQWVPIDGEGKLDTCSIYTDTNSSVSRTCDTYVFDHEEYWGNSLNMRFNLVCSRSWLATTVKVIFTIGLVIGALLVGVIGDRFGRRPALISCMFVGGVTGITAMFSVNIWMYAAFRFVIAMCFVGALLIAHTIIMEVTGPSARTYAISVKTTFWPVGTMFTSLLAYYLHDWQWLQLGISIFPLIMSILMIFFLNETPHFLVTHGRSNEAQKIFRQMAKINGRSIPDHLLENLKEDEKAAMSEKLKSLFKAPVLLKRTAVFFYLWFICGLGFYGLSFNVGNLTGNIYINNAISGAAELPQVFVILSTQRLGRKGPIILLLFGGGVALISCALMYVYVNLDNYGYTLVTVSMIGKFCIATIFSFNYFWTSEVVPTTLRSSLVGLCSLFARIGSILSPIIVDLYLHVQTMFGQGLGPLIFGVTMFVGGVLTFYLPETSKQRLPETIAEANIFRTKKQVMSEYSEGICSRVNKMPTDDFTTEISSGI